MAIRNMRAYADSLRKNKVRYESLWNQVSTLLGDGAYQRLQGVYTGEESKTNENITYDPAIRRIVNTVSDYYLGMVFPLKNPFSLLSPFQTGLYKDWYDKQTKRILNYLQSPDSGFYENAGSVFQDWVKYGNAGFGVFETGNKDKPYFVRGYGIDCLSFNEGRNGAPGYFAIHDKFYSSDIVETFGYDKCPKEIQSDYDNASDNLHEVVCTIVPNSDFKKGSAGKNGMEFLGYWFVGAEQTPIETDEYPELPIAVMRQIKIRGQVYAKSEISMNVGTLQTINASIYTAILNMKNTALPPMGIYKNSVLNGNELDNSAGGLTIFDTDVLLNGATPVFPIMEQGDISPLFNVLVEYLKSEINRLNRMDLIVDIESRTNMTATEFLRRLALKGDALGAILTRLLNQLQPFFTRIVNISDRAGLIDWETAPKEVKDAKKAGKEWYRIGYNTAVNSLLDGVKNSDLLNSINVIAAASSVDQAVMIDVDMYPPLKEHFGDGILGAALTATTSEHKDNKNKAMENAQANTQADTDSKLAKANKDNASAGNAYTRDVP